MWHAGVFSLSWFPGGCWWGGRFSIPSYAGGVLAVMAVAVGGMGVRVPGLLWQVGPCWFSRVCYRGGSGVRMFLWYVDRNASRGAGSFADLLMTVSKSCWSELLSRSSSGSDAMRLFLGRWWRGQVTMRCTHVSGVGSQCGQVGLLNPQGIVCVLAATSSVSRRRGRLGCGWYGR